MPQPPDPRRRTADQLPPRRVDRRPGTDGRTGGRLWWVVHRRGRPRGRHAGPPRAEGLRSAARRAVAGDAGAGQRASGHARRGGRRGDAGGGCLDRHDGLRRPAHEAEGDRPHAVRGRQRHQAVRRGAPAAARRARRARPRRPPEPLGPRLPAQPADHDPAVAQPHRRHGRLRRESGALEGVRARSGGGVDATANLALRPRVALEAGRDVEVLEHGLHPGGARDRAGDPLVRGTPAPPAAVRGPLPADRPAGRRTAARPGRGRPPEPRRRPRARDRARPSVHPHHGRGHPGLDRGRDDGQRRRSRPRGRRRAPRTPAQRRIAPRDDALHAHVREVHAGVRAGPRARGAGRRGGLGPHRQTPSASTPTSPTSPIARSPSRR